MAKLLTLQDPFTGAALDATKWTQTTAGSATFTFAASGAQVNFPASSTSSTLGSLVSSTFDLSDSAAQFRVLSVGSTATAADSELRLQLDASNWIRWVQESGTLFAQKFVAASRSNITTFAYSATNHAWWRIREANGTIFYDTSPDGVAWNNQGTTTVASTFAVTSLSTQIIGSCFQAETSPGTFKFLNFNIVRRARFPNSGLRPRPFAPGLAR